MRTMINDEPIALVGLNMGGPDSLEAIEPFLYNLFSDRELIRLPGGALLQKPFARMISRRRSRKVAPNYAEIGGSSPLLAWTEKQMAGAAERTGHQYLPYVAMRYWNPRADEVVERLKAQGIRKAMILSLYPHFTGATSGSSINDFVRSASRLYPELDYRVIDQWFDWHPYHVALATRIREGLEEMPVEWLPRTQILFSAHALPQKFIDRGDPYLYQVKATVEGVMAHVGNFAYHLAFQSRSGPVKWMEPGTEEMIHTLAREGHKALLMVPVSFVSDHIETLHEIDIEYREEAEEAGIRHFVRAPSLNDNGDFLWALAALVRSKTPSDWLADRK